MLQSAQSLSHDRRILTPAVGKHIRVYMLLDTHSQTCKFTHNFTFLHPPKTAPCKLKYTAHRRTYSRILNFSLCYVCSVEKKKKGAGIAGLPLTAAHLKAPLQQPELTQYLRLGHKLRQHLAPFFFEAAGQSFGTEFEIPLSRSL